MKRILASGILTLLLVLNAAAQLPPESTFKLARTLGLIEDWYVDTTNLNRITEKVIISMLKDLDPHSVYISAKDVKEMNEPLAGNFDGIGIQFNILHDSIIVIDPIAGGPSEKVGLRAGDRIVSINSEDVAGKGISTTGVRTRLLGAKGTKVNVSIFRKGVAGLLDFTITRDKIPINSIDAAYMLDKETGYLKFNKFAATTMKEFSDAVEALKKSNMKNIVIDLRSNGGGIMTAATDMAERFFIDKKLLVYLIGRKTPRQNYESKGGGDLANARLVVLTDEESASASEIFAGAMQDWDRGVVVGRRSFGKGLVQNQFYLTDGSMIRLTIARYYTPTGRLIQSSYEGGYDKYMEDFVKRFRNGEAYSADSIHFPDSLKFKTLVSGRNVYGGGGIMPDVFVPADTSYYSEYFASLSRRGVYNSFILEYSDRQRANIVARFKTFDDFKAGFEFTKPEIDSFIESGEKAGVKFDNGQYQRSEAEIKLLLKALLANNIWQTNEYFRIVNENDPVVNQALKIITDKKKYDEILGKPVK